MKKSGYAESKIIRILKRVEGGGRIKDACRDYDVVL
jgi:hypothetical protein